MSTLGSLLIIGLCVVVSLYAFKNPVLLDRLMLRPYRAVRQRQYSTMLTSGFVHGNMPHLFFNMFTMYFFSPDLERMIGTVHLILLFCFGVIVSSIPSITRHRDDPHYATLGASGGVSSVLIAHILYRPESRIMIFPLPIPIPAVYFAVLYMVYSYLQGKRTGLRVNHAAHFWGAAFGAAYVLLLEPGLLPRFFESF